MQPSKLILIVSVLTAMASSAFSQVATPDNLLQGARLRAEATDVIQLADGQRVKTKVVSEPLFRYSDQPRDILDGTLWAYGTAGRPVALQKIEFYRDEPRSFYCMTSLSDTLIEAGWRDGQKWWSKQPGIHFRPLPDGPKPAATEVGRLFQMKQIARRFGAKLFNPITEQDTQMRPLTRPIYRYSDTDREIKDGVIFGYATYGTNPDVLLSIELHQQGALGPTWKYGLARMTLYKVTATLDDKEIWQVPFAPWQGPGRPAKFDTWVFFHESLVTEAKP